ncbi:MAG TPA: hypothetical protein VEI01_15940 [Terriglobales bacterium]|nr:hypothetical protein [Terriglobales bacterium]
MLPSQKRKLYIERLSQLQRLGLTMPFEYSLLVTRASEIIVEQCGLGIESAILDLSDGRSLYLVWLSLAAETPGACIYDFRFVPPWPDPGFQRLPSFAESHIGEAYVLPDRWEFPRQDVLNLQFENKGWCLPCARVEGLLAAVSDTPIPEQYVHGSLIPVGVEFFGKSGRQLGGTMVTLWADRLTHHGRSLRQSTMGFPVEPSLNVADSAEAHNAAHRFHSRLIEGGELTDSRNANVLRAEGARDTDPGRHSPNPTGQGRVVRGAAEGS